MPIHPIAAEMATALEAAHTLSFSKPWKAQEWRELIASGAFGWVCADDERGGVITALILLRQAADEVELLTIATIPDARRQGLADRLLGHALHEMSQHDTSIASHLHCFLEVRTSNVAAIALYRRHGFRDIATRRGYYPAEGSNDTQNDEREDALVMRR